MMIGIFESLEFRFLPLRSAEKFPELLCSEGIEAHMIGGYHLRWNLSEWLQSAVRLKWN
jgi:hypothetical protein